MGSFNSHQLQTQIRKDIEQYVRRVEEYQQEYRSEAHYPNYFFLIHEYRIGLKIHRLQLVIWRKEDYVNSVGAKCVYTKPYTTVYSVVNDIRFVTQTLELSQDEVFSKVKWIEDSFTTLNKQVMFNDFSKVQEIIKKHGGNLLSGNIVDGIIVSNLTVEAEAELKEIGARVLVI
jgi:hypothetical protein